MEKFRPPGDCPVCGAYVEKGSMSCDECGSCSDTGWNEEAAYDGLDLPGEEFASDSNDGVSWLKYLVILILVALIAYAFVLN
ncbi:MAG: hypothetical protein AAGB46_17825 [Verrucomicrobiota bacterium]